MIPVRYLLIGYWYKVLQVTAMVISAKAGHLCKQYILEVT